MLQTEKTIPRGIQRAQTAGITYCLIRFLFFILPENATANNEGKIASMQRDKYNGLIVKYLIPMTLTAKTVKVKRIGSHTTRKTPINFSAENILLATFVLIFSPCCYCTAVPLPFGIALLPRGEGGLCLPLKQCCMGL
jgi:hypothetical protein